MLKTPINFGGTQSLCLVIILCVGKRVDPETQFQAFC